MSSVLSSLSLYCYDYYQHDQCCPRQECIPINSRTGRTLRPRKTCRFVGKEYQLGEKIHLSDIIVHQQKIANLSESDQLDIDENRIEYDNNDDRQRKKEKINDELWVKYCIGAMVFLILRIVIIVRVN